MAAAARSTSFEVVVGTSGQTGSALEGLQFIRAMEGVRLGQLISRPSNEQDDDTKEDG